VPARILERLAAAGVRDLAQWRQLTRRQRKSLAGVPIHYVDLLDELAEAVGA
jgi:hypothetical protein